MLKHASNASSAGAGAGGGAGAGAAVPAAAVTVNGQLLRPAANAATSSSSNNNNNNGSNGSGNNTPSASTATTTAAATATTTTTASGGPAPPLPVKGTSPTPSAGTVARTTRYIHLRPPQPQPLNISALNASTCSTLYNGGGRVANGNASTLLNIVTPVTPLTPVSPLTPVTPNGLCNGTGNGSLHHHTYTNQHILANSQQQQLQQQQQQQQSALSHHHPHQQLHRSYSNCNNRTTNTVLQKVQKRGPSPREALNSLGLLCLVSLLLALLSLIFLLKISPNSREYILTRTMSSEDFIIVYDVTLALCALSLALNLCCLLVCAIQFLFAVKLRSPVFDGRDNRYLEKSSASRTCAVSGFFISIPVFLTGIILYTFNHFHSTPAIITSVLIGLGIVFCGVAMVHNVFVWQKEKTISYKKVMPLNMSLPSAASQFPITPPVQFLSPVPVHGQQVPSVQLYQVGQPMLSVTPVSPNHSHGSFNPLLCPGNNNNLGLGGGGAINSSYLIRPATATPPTPKPSNCQLGREASGSVSPGIPNGLDMSNITMSLHELSTLV